MGATTSKQLHERIGHNVRKLRERQNLSQSALADKAKRRQSTVSFVETSGKGISLGLIVDLSRALGVDPVELFRRPRALKS